MRLEFDEKSLIRKLVVTYHLSVPERRLLPDGHAKASLVLDAIEAELRSAGWYPSDCRPDMDYNGGLIERTSEETGRIHWKWEVGLLRYERAGITEYPSTRVAAEAYLQRFFPDHIDGVPIHWGQ